MLNTLRRSHVRVAATAGVLMSAARVADNRTLADGRETSFERSERMAQPCRGPTWAAT